MKLDSMDIVFTHSIALDTIERENIPSLKPQHGKRVAYMCYLMGKEAGLNPLELRDFVSCAILHDCALAEYERIRRDEAGTLFGEKVHRADMDDPSTVVFQETGTEAGLHCSLGEARVRSLPFRTDISNIVLYHHERVDGKGPFGRKEGEVPIQSQMLHLADRVDVYFARANRATVTLEQIRAAVKEHTGTSFSKEVSDLFLKVVGVPQLRCLADQTTENFLREHIPEDMREYTDEEIRSIATFLASIVDYKSSFTKNHSMGVAEKAWEMGGYYGFDADKRIRYYFAGAMHDVGKLIIPNDILEKPGKLTQKEFSLMKHHAEATYWMLARIRGIEDIREWASNHHEKLDGSGYPRGLRADELSFEDRLMACIDIYQALTEDRPYKAGMGNREAFAIMKKNTIDQRIVEDMEKVYCIRTQAKTNVSECD